MEVIGNNLSDDVHVQGVTLTMRDISERTSLEAELRRQASHDSLTGLANRVLFRERVHHALGQRFQLNKTVAVMVIDIDDFKFVNDTLGHAAGDTLLVEFSRRLMGCIRADDTAARLGGDEFAVCATLEFGTDVEVAELARRVRSMLVEPFEVEGVLLHVAVSVGASIAREGLRNSTDMLREADLALYAAKNSGKGSFRLFEPELHYAVVARLERRKQLADAIVRGELRLLYQPIVRLADGEIVGLEALVRWEHPTDGLLPPSRVHRHRRGVGSDHPARPLGTRASVYRPAPLAAAETAAGHERQRLTSPDPLNGLPRGRRRRLGRAGHRAVVTYLRDHRDRAVAGLR